MAFTWCRSFLALILTSIAPWAKIKHDTKEESVLFSFSDRPVQELLGLFREKIYN